MPCDQKMKGKKGKGGKKGKRALLRDTSYRWYAFALGWLLALGLASSQALAQESDKPTFGCGGGTCSVYFLDVSWPPAIGVNAVEFARLRLGVGVGGIAELGQVSPLGGVCLIPRVGDALGPACGAVGTGG